jgi:hypothetical protein
MVVANNIFFSLVIVFIIAASVFGGMKTIGTMSQEKRISIRNWMIVCIFVSLFFTWLTSPAPPTN